MTIGEAIELPKFEKKKKTKKDRFIVMAMCIVFNIPIIMPSALIWDSKYKCIKHF